MQTCYDESAVAKTLVANPNYINVSGVTFSNTDKGVVATILNDTTAFSIPQDIKVDSVVLSRTFTSGAFSTLMLPFDIDLDSVKGIKGIDTIATFTQVNLDTAKNAYVSATGTRVTSSLSAYTPYLLKTNAENLTVHSAVTLKTTDLSNATTTNGNWSFIGTVANRKWVTDGEYASEIGSIYGFAGVEKDSIKVGTFVKAKSGASVRPLRAYLKFSASAASKMPAALGKAIASTEDVAVVELPASFPVIFVDPVVENPVTEETVTDETVTDEPTTEEPAVESSDVEEPVAEEASIDNPSTEVTAEDNQTEAILPMAPSSGVNKSNVWHDLKGRSLNKKPSAQGAFINNRSPVVVK